MRDSFDELMQLCKKSLRHDPWVKDRGLRGYCEEIAYETQEAIEAIDKNDYKNLKEELGDVLLDWMHACLLAEDEEHFTGKEVVDDVKDKLVRRKPYITQNRTPSKNEAAAIWNSAKQQEREDHD